MPRDAVTITELTANSASANPAGTTVVVANGAVINGVKDSSRVLVRLRNTDASPRVATFLAGDNPPALRAGVGNLEVTVPASTGDVLVVLESARFLQSDGTIQVDFAASFAGTISAVRLPKAA